MVQPFDSPRIALEPARPRPGRALVLVLAPAIMTGLVMLLLALNQVYRASVPDTVLGVGFGLAAVAAVVGTFWGAHLWWRLGRLPAAVRPEGLALAVGATLLGPFSALYGAVLALLTTVQFTRGRQVRRLGRPTYAPLVGGDGWASKIEASETARGVADAWRRNGRTEHASVAAFAEVAHRLVAEGAPASLVRAAHADALDEIRHAELCWGLAESMDGQKVGPGVWPQLGTQWALGPRPWRLARLAVDALLDGCLLEAVSARTVAQMVNATEKEAVRQVLEEIARDEARHAAHAWAVLRWALAQGGAPVSAAVLGALRVLPEELGAPLHPEAEDGRWQRYGIPSRALEEDAYRVVRARVVAKVLRFLEQPTSAAA